MNLARTAVAVSLSAALAAGALLPAPATAAPAADLRGVVTDPLLRRAYVTDRDTAVVSIIDLDHLTRVAAVATGATPVALVSDAVSSRLYVLNDGTPGAVSVVDAWSGAVLHRITVGDTPHFLAADLQRGELYASNAASSTLSIIDLRANAVVATVPVGIVPAGIGVDTIRGRIYVANDADATITVIDQTSREAIDTFAVGYHPQLPSVDERSGRIYVNNVADMTVSVLDGQSGRLVALLPAGRGSTSGTLSPEYRKYFLPNAGDNTVTVIDIDGNRVADTVPVGGSPQEASIDADGGVVYVANRADGTISVLDARTGALLGTVTVPPHPANVAIPVAQSRVLVVDESAAGLDGVAALEKSRVTPGTAIASEYFHADFGLFFHTADAVEKRLLSDGMFGTAWQATGEFWRVWTVGGVNRVPVCRFLSNGFQPRSSHVYSLYPECTVLKRGGSWSFESIAYYVAMPDGNGTCSAGLTPLYRLYNDAQGGVPNHRFTASAAVRDTMQAKGWIAEGKGDGHVFACTPPLTEPSIADGVVVATSQTPVASPVRVPFVPDTLSAVTDTDSGPPTMVRLPLSPDARPLTEGDPGAQQRLPAWTGRNPLLYRPL